MHTLNRFLVLTVGIGLLVPLLLGGKLLSTLTRDDFEGKFSEAVDNAKDTYRESANLGMSERVNRRIVSETETQLKQLEKRKRELRLKIADLLSVIRNGEKRADVLALVEERSSSHLRRERERAKDFVRGIFSRTVVADSRTPGRLLLQRITGESLGEAIEADLRENALTRAKRQITQALLQARDSSRLSRATLHAAAGDVSAELEVLRQEREEVLEEYFRVQRSHDQAQQNLALTADQLEEIQQEALEVEKEIARMQGEMARIDGRLRSRAERELIQKGLIEAKPDRYRESKFGGFTWPVEGTLTAGFHLESYRRYFGIPHQGQDIAVDQGTEVRSTAEGIVFLARDGGTRGYSYILIGHRDGYATLYGHLSEFMVKTGDDVHQGQVIGLSGGRPGTHGAGPMTTGPHLHFEVLKNGEHVDPISVLP